MGYPALENCYPDHRKDTTVKGGPSMLSRFETLALNHLSQLTDIPHTLGFRSGDSFSLLQPYTLTHPRPTPETAPVWLKCLFPS